MYFPFSRQAHVGNRIGASAAIEAADFILVLDCDVPWIPIFRCGRMKTLKIFHVDLGLWKAQMSLFYPSNRPLPHRQLCDTELTLLKHSLVGTQ